jgi:hypothetical protein
VPNLSPGQRRALYYWSQIRSAAAQGWGTAQLWESIRSHQEATGDPAPRVSAIDVGQLRAQAAAIERSAAAFERQSGDNAVTSDMIAEAPWARPLDQRNTLPMWQIRFEHTVNGPQGDRTQWRSTVYRGTLPPTVSQLRAEVEADAAAMALDYNTEHVSTGPLEILAT